MPSWRRVSIEWPLSRTSKDGKLDWSSLRCGGANGFVVMLIALSWWISKVMRTEFELQALSIVEDLSWTLEALADDMQAEVATNIDSVSSVYFSLITSD
jgi:hypothetical protein